MNSNWHKISVEEISNSDKKQNKTLFHTMNRKQIEKDYSLFFENVSNEILALTICNEADFANAESLLITENWIIGED